MRICNVKGKCGDFYRGVKIDYRQCDDKFDCKWFTCDNQPWDGKSSSDCWIERCNNECGQNQCKLWNASWNATKDAYDWTKDQCPTDWTEEGSAAYARATRIANAFSGSSQKIQSLYCESGDCIGEGTMSV